jgi:Man1-Src1p-C-terminal domain
VRSLTERKLKLSETGKLLLFLFLPKPIPLHLPKCLLTLVTDQNPPFGRACILLSSSSLANLSLACTVRRSLRLTLSRNRGPLAALIFVVALFFEVKRRIQKYRTATRQIPQLVDIALDRLATQAALKEDGRVAESFISVGQLRDDVLRNVFSSSERERVWAGVRKIVEANSNIRAATREGAKTGEWSRVWEWIGPVNLAPAVESRKSGGLMKDEREIEAEYSALSENGGQDQAQREVRKWDEGRPIY